MKNAIIPIIFVFCLIFIVLKIQASRPMSYENALKQNKPIILLFSKKTCSACRSFEPLFEIISSKYSYKYTFVKENIDSISINPPEYLKEFNISYVPMLILVDPIKKEKYNIEYECMQSQKCLEDTLEQYK